MPIRINLKEIFSSDPQEILVDKLNFNYNKLLELGVGTPGPTGLTGPQGPAGPIGLVGPQGDRGATWWVDSGDPNTLTFTGLIDGDLYLDQTSNVFQVWKYDDGTSTWVTVVSIAAIVTSYLSSLSNIPFETVTTFQAPGSTAVNKFILFDKRDDYVADTTRGTANVSLNNMLFLNNFDETDVTYPILGQDQYNSLLSIFPAHDDTQDSGRAQSGRYHIEMGSLYMDSDVLPVGTIKYSDLKHNLKAKFYKQYVDPILPPQLPATNTWINTARFSLSYTESQSLLDIDQNAVFEFLFPKWNSENPSIGGVTSWTADGLGTGYTTATGVATTSAGGGTGLTVNITAVLGAITAVIVNNLGSGYEVGDIVTINGGSTSESLTITSVILPVQEELSVVLSSAEAIVERSPAHTHIVADGIHVSTKSSSINATLGLALDYSSLNAKLDAKNHLMLDSNSGVDGVILLNKGTFVNGDANIVDGLAIGSGYEDLTAPANSLIVEGKVGIGIATPDANTKHHIYETGSAIIKITSLTQLDSLSFSGFIKFLAVDAISINDISGSPTVVLQNNSFTGNNAISSFTGNNLDFSSTLSSHTFSGTQFCGNKISLLNSSDFTTLSSALEITGNLFTLSPVITSSSNGKVYGNKFVLQPDLSSATGGTIRGNQIEITSYSPNSTTEIRGTQTTIEQLIADPQGITYGSVTNIQVNSSNSLSSDLIGQQINVNTTGVSLPTTSYGSRIIMGTNLPSPGTAYGYHIVGATDNYAEGASRFKGSVSINNNDSYVQYVKNTWTGWATWGFNVNLVNFSFALDESGLPTGFGGTYATSGAQTAGGTTAIWRFNHPTIDPNKSTLLATPRFGGAGSAPYVGKVESTGLTTFCRITATQSYIIFTNIGSTAWTNDSLISFSFTLTEWA
jgi:hypothetical protein